MFHGLEEAIYRVRNFLHVVSPPTSLRALQQLRCYRCKAAKKICKLVEGTSTVHTAASINDEVQYSQYLGIGSPASIPSAHHPIHVMPSLFPLDLSATGHRMSPLLSTLSSMSRLDPPFNTYFHFGHRTLFPYDAARSVVGRTSHLIAHFICLV